MRTARPLNRDASISEQARWARRAARAFLSVVLDVAAALAAAVCVYLAAEARWAGRWFFPPEPLRYAFLYGPATGLALVLAGRGLARRAHITARWAPVVATAPVVAVLTGLALAAASEPTGLWREWTALDSHFSNQIIRGYYFPPTLGLAGLAAVALSYWAIRLALASPGRFARAPLWPLVAVALFGALWAAHAAIPKPRFVG